MLTRCKWGLPSVDGARAQCWVESWCWVCLLCFPWTWELSHRESESLGMGTPLFASLLSSMSLFQAAAGQVSLQSQQDNQGMAPSQKGLSKGRSCLANLTSFHEVLLMRERLWMLSTWMLIKSLRQFPAAFSWRNWLFMLKQVTLLGRKLSGWWRCHCGERASSRLQADLLISTHSLEVSYTPERALCEEVVWVFFKLQADNIIWLCLVLELWIIISYHLFQAV